jgi:glutathione S-transferase
MVPMMLRGGVRKSVTGQGVGRMSTDRLQRRVDEDLGALATFLGDRDWFFTDRPTTTDAMVYAFTANVLAQPWSAMLQVGLQAHSNLVDHAERMGSLLYPDATRD